LRIAHLYAEEMNIYGDRGNILTLVKRAQWRGIEVAVEAIGRGPIAGLDRFDLIFWGGGQDRDQALVFTDAAAHKADAIARAVADGSVVLARTGQHAGGEPQPERLASERVTLDLAAGSAAAGRHSTHPILVHDPRPAVKDASDGPA